MMIDMMRNIRSWLKASSTISKRRNPSCFRSFKASWMRRKSAQKWRVGRNSSSNSRADVRPKLKVALEHANRGKEVRLKGAGEHPEDDRVKKGLCCLLAICREGETVRIRHE